MKKSDELHVTIPRMCGKRISIIMEAMKQVTEGHTVVLHDIGGCAAIVMRPVEIKQNKGDSQKMAKFRKKPVEIEAYQTDKEMDIKTLEGTMHANVGDWIITGVNGEQYPCKPDIFEKTYEPVRPKEIL